MIGRALALVLLLGGCDMLLGLDQLHPGRSDAPGAGDGDSDDVGSPPGSCPIGSAPSFSVAGAVGRPCRDLSVAGTSAAATCYPSGSPVNESGPLAAPWTAFVLPPMRSQTLVETPRLSPEGTEIFAREVDLTDGNETIDWYSNTSGTWLLAGTIPLGQVMSSEYVSAPTRADRQRYILLSETATDLLELADLGDGRWMASFAHSAAELGVGQIVQPNLSADGLRLVFVGDGGNIYYATRTAVDTAFGAATLLYAVPGGAVTPYLADDCSALYYAVAASPQYQLYRAEPN
ncbi:MAG TPA: hypothetical protein VGF94_10520 [Kofleriaceae bacterium]